MSQQANNDLECRVCNSGDDLTFAIVTEEKLDESEYTERDPIVVCTDHLSELVESNGYYVRELAPVPDERGGFQRTTDGEGRDILYDHDESQDAWVRFDPDKDEFDLSS